VPDGPVKTALGGLVNRKQRWSLSFKGWIFALLFVVAFCAGAIHFVHSFLAVQAPVPATILVVEGWMADTEIPALVAEFHRGNYQKVYTTGGEIHWGSSENYAEYSAKCLTEAGLPKSVIVPVACAGKDWARTFQSAAALRNYFEKNKCAPASLNVITVGPHARRSRLLFRRALGHNITVGVIALPREDYDEQHWWRSSTGIREVISELAAYLYCRITPTAFEGT
jgi:uncharacterized SAM-binding protein YcdF (DUF218 family)